MFYPDEIIEEVRNQNDIVDVISEYVKLQKKGANYFGLCPFQFLRENKCIIVSDVVKEEMLFHL